MPRWDFAEVAELRQLAAEGLGAQDIADRLGRDRGQVYGAANARGIRIQHVHECTVRCVILGRARPEAEVA